MNIMEDADWQQNESFMFNVTAANTNSSYKELLSPMMNKTLNISMGVIVFITMVSLGCTMEVSKIKQHLVKPKGVVIAVLAQYGVMPFTAFCLTKAFKLEELEAVVVLLCGCCPGGIASNILTLALQGDMNLSILMTSSSSLLALGMMPLLLYIYCQGLNLQNAVPYVEIITSLVMLIVPCTIGILINRYRPQYSKLITKVGIISMTIATCVIAIITGFTGGRSLLVDLSPKLLAIAALMPFTGFTFGYLISWIFRLSQPERRTVAVETGCQNAALCMAILKLAFPLELIRLLFLFPIVYLFAQVMEAVVLIVLFWGHKWFTLRWKEKYQAAVTEES